MAAAIPQPPFHLQVVRRKNAGLCLLQLPELTGIADRVNPGDLWTWCLAQDNKSLLGLLAYCVSRTVNTVQLKGDRPGCERFAHADALTKALDIDMAAWFRPSAENYFARISKTAILEALTEIKGGTAPAWDKAKKADLAAIAEREIAQTGWLPPPLRRAA